MLSMANAVCVFPTERHQSTGTGVRGECTVISRAGTSSTYGESVTPSTEVASTPFLTMNCSNGVPARIDWPTMVCFHATGAPLPSRPTSIRCRKSGR